MNNNKPEITLRQATPADLFEMRRLYADTITSVCANDYNEAQRKVWAATSEKEERWQNLIETQLVLLAVAEGVIAGFSSLHDGNYLDFMYVHKDYQRMGIAETLLKTLEAEAVKLGVAEITSDVSITARPFFEKKGYTVLNEQKNEKDGLILINYKMYKRL